jgi:hypothetical protein
MSNTTKTQSLTAEQILERILKAKGNFVKAVWKSNPTPAAAHKKAGIILEKHTSAVCRSGINYANLSAVQNAIESGERPAEIGPLPFGTWKNYPYVIEHTNKEGEYCEYLRLYPSGTPPKSIYYVNGEEVTKEDFAQYLTASDANKLLNPKAEDAPLCFTIKKDNILSVPLDVCD